MICDANSLVQNARCLETCLPPGLWLPALIRLLAALAGTAPDAAALMEQAKCIECAVPPGMQLSVLTNVVSQITLNPQIQMQIALLANFVDGVAHPALTVDYPDMTGAVGLRVGGGTVLTATDLFLSSLNYVHFRDTADMTGLSLPLLASLAADLDGTNSALPNLSLPALVSVGGSVTLGSGLLSILSLPKLKTVGASLNLNNLVNLPSVSLPELTTVGTDVSMQGGNLGDISLPKLTKCLGFFGIANIPGGNLSVPLLNTVGSTLQVNSTALATALAFPALVAVNTVVIESNAALASINLGLVASLQSGLGSLILTGNPALLSLDIHSLNEADSVFASGNEAMTTVQFKASNTILNWNLQDNALTEASVDALLASCVAGGAAGGTLSLDGGTNAAPSAGGAADVATLQANGWTVTTN